MCSFKLHPVYTEDDFRHWFLPRAQVIESYVVESPTTGELTDFLSFYHLPSTVIGMRDGSRTRCANARQPL